MEELEKNWISCPHGPQMMNARDFHNPLTFNLQLQQEVRIIQTDLSS